VKLLIICLSVSFILTSLISISAAAIDLGALTKSSTKQLQKIAKDVVVPLKTNAMIEYTARQLDLSEATVTASFGSLLKVAQDNLSQENFTLISKAVPNAQNYVDKAPEVAKSSMSSLFSSTSDSGKKAESIDYLNSVFKQLGISSEKIPGLIDSFSGYLDKSGYKEASAMLKKGISFF
jgi:hypothetical protein